MRIRHRVDNPFRQLMVSIFRRRGARAWLLLAAVGLAFGLITIVMPVLATATVATTMTFGDHARDHRTRVVHPGLARRPMRSR